MSSERRTKDSIYKISGIIEDRGLLNLNREDLSEITFETGYIFGRLLSKVGFRTGSAVVVKRSGSYRDEEASEVPVMSGEMVAEQEEAARTASPPPPSGAASPPPPSGAASPPPPSGAASPPPPSGAASPPRAAEPAEPAEPESDMPPEPRKISIKRGSKSKKSSTNS
jgi:hypothetical protein